MAKSSVLAAPSRAPIPEPNLSLAMSGSTVQRDGVPGEPGGRAGVRAKGAIDVDELGRRVRARYGVA